MFQLKMALSRTFPIREGMSLQVRGEAFNLPNYLNAGNPGTAMNSPQFGVVSTDQSGNLGGSTQFGAGDYRIIQFSRRVRPVRGRARAMMPTGSAESTHFPPD